MKKWFSRSAVSNIGRYRLRILFAILILSSVTTILATLVVSRVYSAEIIGELTNALSVASGSDSQYIGLINKEVSYLMLDLNNDPATINFLNLQADDPMVEYELARRLRDVKNVYPFIQSIVLYNGKDDRIISTDMNPGSTGNYGDQALSTLLRGEFKNRITVIPRKAAATGNLITYILVTPRPGEKTAESAVIVNIYESTFGSKNPSPADNGSVSFIVDQGGIVVSHTDKNEISKDYSGYGYLKGILANSNESGTGPCSLNGGDYIYSYSTVSDINWKLVSLVPLKDVLAKPAEIQIRIIFIAGVILLASIVLSGFISEFVYRPVSKLLNIMSADIKHQKNSSRMDEIDYISKTYSDILEKTNALQSQNQVNAELLRNEFLKALLTDDLNPAYISRQLDFFQITVCENGLRLLLVETDRYYDVKEQYVAGNHEESIHGIFNNVFGPEEGFLLFPMSSWRFCILLGAPAQTNGNAQDEIVTRVEKTQYAVKALLGYSLSVSLSPVISDLSELRPAYQQALQLIKYKTLIGLGRVLSPDMLKDRIDIQRHYSAETESAIINAFNSCKKDEFQGRIDKLLAELSQGNYEDFRNVIMEAGLSCIRQVEKVCRDREVAFSQNVNFNIEKLQYLESLDEIRQWFAALFERRQIVLDDIRFLKSMNDNTQKIIESALDYIHRNFMKGDLSVESIADQIGYSSNYFSKAFRKVTGAKVIDYISGIRMEEAKRLLKTTELNVSEVAIRSGFININYFYYAFKKATGMTPDNYRFMIRL